MGYKITCITQLDHQKQKEMENGTKQIWGFRGNEELKIASEITVRGFLNLLMFHVNKDDDRPTVPLGHGDPSAFPSFRTTGIAEDAIVDALRTANYNCYAPTVGVLPARRYVRNSINVISIISFI